MLDKLCITKLGKHAINIPTTEITNNEKGAVLKL